MYLDAVWEEKDECSVAVQCKLKQYATFMKFTTRNTLFWSNVKNITAEIQKYSTDVLDFIIIITKTDTPEHWNIYKEGNSVSQPACFLSLRCHIVIS